MTLARTLVIALTICCAQWTTARSHYCTAHNAFGSLATGAATCSLENERLLVSNSAATPLMIMDTTLVAGNGNSTYQYTVRASLLTNKAGSSYVVTDEHGRRSRVSSTAWGVAFGYIDGLNYARVELRCANTNLYDDLTDRRQMVVTAVATQAGTDSVLQQWTLDRGLSLEDGLNSVRVTVTDGEATIAVGNKQLQTLGMVTLPSADGPTQRTGLFLSAGARLALERTVLTSDSEAPHRVATAWTREALDQHFATSSDPVEGYWQYQDRDIEERWLRLGGRYTLAVVAANGGYDIIYIAGAQVNEPQWQCGLLKGHLAKTIYDGHYDLQWIDATFEPIVLDAYATIENDVLMSLNFPVYKSLMRLSKILSPSL